MKDGVSERYIYTGYPIDAVPVSKFAEMIGKQPSAVRDMVTASKLPIIPMQNPEARKPRSENWIYLPEFNERMREAFFARPKEQRDAWLLWLGL